MTTDKFTTAACAEAERRAPLDGHPAPALAQEREGLVAMAEWALTHLAAQEPTDAEHRAATDAVRALLTGQTARPLDMDFEKFMTVKASRIAHAALSAARAARRNEEKR